MAKNTDLHTHSHYSDGRSSPKQLIRLAKKRRVKYFALTDHNSIKGVKEAIAEGKKVGINVIPAVEITFDGGEILGYFINIKNKELVKGLKQNSKKIEDRTKDWCNKLNKEGYPVSFKEIQKKFPKAKGNINGTYPMYVLYKKGWGKTTMKIAQELRKNKKLKPKKIKEMSIIQAIKLVRKAGGVAVLAHPWCGEIKEYFKSMGTFIKAGLRGIEISNGDKAPFKPKGTDKKIRRIAKKYKLIITRGSDYHGEEWVKLMPGDHRLGKNNCDEKVVEKLKKLIKK